MSVNLSSKTALVTGASKGIGREIARLLAEQSCNLVLVARTTNNLLDIKTELEHQYDISVHVFSIDLTISDAPSQLFAQLSDKNISVDYLINNAGFGEYGFFLDSDWTRLQQMIQLNITTLTQMCYLFANDWKSKRVGGRILNVSSIAAFQPGPQMAVYFATKGYVLQLSEALREEFAPYGITVSTLCPGPTKTFFGEDSGMDNAKLINLNMEGDAQCVASLGVNALLHNKSVVVHGFINKLMVFCVRFLPRTVVTKITARLMAK